MKSHTTAPARSRLAIRTVVVRISRKLRATYRIRTGRLFSHLLLAMVAVCSPLARALPQDPTVQAGQATVTTPTANAMVVNQATPKAIIDWRGFSIGQGQSVQFVQPGASSVALNRVTGGNPSAIYGALNANGQVFLVNPAGVMFAPGAQVNVGGLVASTLDLSNTDFLNGQYRFSGSGGSVVNQGSLKGRYVVLAAPSVTNSGSIDAHGGSVGLLAGSRVTVDPVGDGLVKFSVDAAAVNAAIVNSGTITADGGQVAVLASAVSDTLHTVINQSGVIRANSIAEQGGTIVLSGGASGVVSVSGTLEARGVNAGETGGTVKVLGDRVGLMAGAKVDASGDAGGGTVLVGGNFQGQGPEQNAAVTYVDAAATIKADATEQGDGGRVIVWADGSTRFAGHISAKGSATGGDGGFAEVSGKEHLAYQGTADLRAPLGRAGDLLLDPSNLTVLHGAAGGTSNVNGVPNNPEEFSFMSTASPSVITDGTINAQLPLSNVIVQTGPSGAESGDITFDAAGGPIVFNAGGSARILSFFAHRHITVNSATTYTNGTGALNLFSGSTGSIAINAALTNTGGNLNVFAGRDISVTAAVAASAAARTVAFSVGDAGAGGTFVATAPITAGGSVSVSGGAGNDTFDLRTAVIGTVSGGGGSDTLIGRNIGSTWTVSGANSGNYNGEVSFTDVENLTGNASADNFTFGASGALSGRIDGAGGSDSVNYAAATGVTNVTLGTNVVNVETLGGTAGQTLSGANIANAWVLTGSKQGIVTDGDGAGTASFSGFGGIVGGSGADTFTVATGVGSFNGSINGGSGANTLAATDGSNAWAVTAANAGTLNGTTTFGNINTLTGGTGADAFTMASGVTTFNGAINGGAGANTVAATDGTNAWSAGSLNGTTTFSNIQTVAGGTGTDTFSGAAGGQAFSITGAKAVTVGAVSATGMEALVGGSGNDTFTLASGVASFNGSIDGGAGSNTLAATDGTNTWAISGADAGTLNGGTAFSGIRSLTGGTGNDNFVLANAGTLSGTISAGAGTGDTLDLGAKAGAVAISTAGTATGTGGFSGIENVVGNGSTTLQGSSFNLTGANSGTADGLAYGGVSSLQGAAGANSFTGAGGSVTGTIADGGVSSTLSGTITSGGSQTYTGAATLGGTTTLSAGGGTGTINLAAVNLGANTLTLTGTSTTGAITGTGSLTANGDLAAASLNVGNAALNGDTTSAGSVFLNGTLVTGGSLTASSVFVQGPVTLGGNVTTSGTQTYLSAIDLAADVALDATGGGTLPAGASISTGAVAGHGHDLTIDAGTAGAVTATYVAGADNVTIVNAGSAEVGGIVNTLTVNSTGNVTLWGTTVAGTASVAAGGTLTQGFALSAATLTGSAASATLTNAGNAIAQLGAFSAANGFQLTTAGATTITGAVNGGTGATVITTNGNLAVNNAVSGAGVTLAAGGAGSDIALGAAVNAGTGMATLTADSDITRTAGTITANGAVLTATSGSVTADVATATLTGSAGTSATISGNATTLAGFTTGSGFTMTDAGGLTVGAAVTGGTGAASITTTGGALAVNANVTGEGVTLAGTGVTQAVATTVNAGAGEVTVDGNDSAIHLGGAITTTSNSVTAVRVIDATTAALGNITTGTTGTVTLGGAGGDNLSGAVTQNAVTVIDAGTVTVNGGSTVVLAGANTVDRLGPVTSNGAFSFNNAGPLTVAGAVNAGTGGVTLQTTAGALDILAAGDITAGNAVSLTGAAGIRTAGDVTTGIGGVTYNSPATLTGAIVMAAASFTAGTVDGGGNDLTLTGGGSLANATNLGAFTAGTNATLDGNIGAATYNLRGGTVDAALGAGTLNQVSGTTTFNGTSAAGTVNVDGGTLVLGPTADRLGTPTSVAIAAGATLDTGTASQALGGATLTNAGTLVAVGGLSAGSIASTGTATLAGSVSTTGNQDYSGVLQAAPGATLTAGGDITANNAANVIGTGTTFGVTAGGSVAVGGDFAGAVQVTGNATSVNLDDRSEATQLVVAGLSAAPSANVTLTSAGALQVDAAALFPVANLTATTQNGDMVFLNSGTLQGGTPGLLATGALTLDVTGGALNSAADPLLVNAATGSVNISAAQSHTRWLGHEALPPAAAPAPAPAPAPAAAPVAANDDLANAAVAVAGALAADLDDQFAASVRDAAGLLRRERLVWFGSLTPSQASAPLQFRSLSVRLPRCVSEQRAGEAGCR